MRFPTLLTTLAVCAATTAHAQQIYVPADYQCSVQILVAVDRGMPPGMRDLEPARLSCMGLTQVHMMMTDPEMNTAQTRRAVESVFRREGLTR